MHSHTVHRYDEELRQLHDMVLEAATIAREQIAKAVESLDKEDVQAAREVIQRDREVNNLDIRVQEKIVAVLACRQPMARDLRKILTVSKCFDDLERIGDQARRIAKLCVRLYGNGGAHPNKELLRDIPKLAETADHMIGLAIAAFDEMDVNKALEVIQMDDGLARDFQAAVRGLSTYVMEDARSVGFMVEAVLGLRSLERIGGHAENIGRHTIFLIRGLDVRHDTLEEVVAEVGGRK